MNKSPVLISKRRIKETLKSSPKKGKRLLEPFKTFAANNQIPFNILEDKEVTNEPEIHTKEGDLWYCLKGRVKFICGGVMVDKRMRVDIDGNPNKLELTGTKIKDGKICELYPGDWLWIPAGIPHQHFTDSTVRLIIIKISEV